MSTYTDFILAPDTTKNILVEIDIGIVQTTWITYEPNIFQWAVTNFDEDTVFDFGDAAVPKPWVGALAADFFLTNKTTPATVVPSLADPDPVIEGRYQLTFAAQKVLTSVPWQRILVKSWGVAPIYLP